MSGSVCPPKARKRLRVLALACAGVLAAVAARGAEVLVIGDVRLKPVAELVTTLHQSLPTAPSTASYEEVRGELRQAAARERARVVVALGKEAVAEALGLPPPVAVIYGLTVVAPQTARPNTTGVSMATPVSEYQTLLRRYLPSVRRLATAGSHELLKAVGATGQPQVSTQVADSSVNLVASLTQFEGIDAVLLLPDPVVLTPTALEECYLYSFRSKVPLLGVSEKHVKQGALLALAFDPAEVGRQIGRLATQALAGADLGRIPPSAPRAFDLFVNADTARRMGIVLPPELLKRARRVYP